MQVAHMEKSLGLYKKDRSGELRSKFLGSGSFDKHFGKFSDLAALTLRI